MSKLRKEIFKIIDNEVDWKHSEGSMEVATDLLIELFASHTREIIEEVKKEFYRGCTKDEVVPRLDALLDKLVKEER